MENNVKVSFSTALKDTNKYNKMLPKDRVQLRKKRLYDIVTYAKENSAFYKELYKDIPEHFVLADIPTTSRAKLLEDYSAWTTDSDVSLDGIYAHMEAHPDSSVKYLDKYEIVSSSGIESDPLISLYDDNCSVYLSAEAASRIFARKEHFWAFVTHGARVAYIYSTSGAFFPTVYARMIAQNIPLQKRKSLLLQAQSPISQLVSALNGFNPAILDGYPSALLRLADEKKAGRLKISPRYIMASGEELSEESRERLSTVFGCDVSTSYFTAETGVIGFECREHHLHINEDWCIVEPVDFDNNPVADGEPCDHILVTNLMNFTQPVIRYALDDKVIVHTSECLCGNPSPYLEVVGKSLDQLVFNNGSSEILIPVDELDSLMNSIDGIKRYQLLIYPNNYVSLRLLAGKGYDKTSLYFKVEKVLRSFLNNLGVITPAITLEKEEPQPDPLSGKYLTIITE